MTMEEYGRDPGLQFYWLEKVLEKAKAKKQTVRFYSKTRAMKKTVGYD